MSDSQAVAGGESPAELLLRVAAMVPAERYALAAVAVVSVFLYRFLELHVIGDALRGFRGGRVELTFHPASEIYHRVASKCRSLHGRYGSGLSGLAPQFSGSTNVGRVWSIVMKFASWGSELRDALIALYEVSLSWES